MDINLILDSLIKLGKYCKKEGYKGYSLYDSHDSFIPFEKFGKNISFFANQSIKRSPINIRPLIGVKKEINPKGYGLFLHIYSLLSQMNLINKDEASEKAHYFYKWLIQNPSQNYSGHCWGYNYDWPRKDGRLVPACTPSVVVTGFIARALLSYYENLNKEEVKQILKSSTKFVLNDVNLYKGKEGWCFSYTPVMKDLVINANLLAAEVLAYSDVVNHENNFHDYIKNVIEFTYSYQNENGSWYYSFDYDNKNPKKQLDFHQGYVLESLFRLGKYTQIDMSQYESQFRKGLDFYYNNQFSDSGIAYWRIPKKWPVDVHNQSQGIITFSTLKKFDEKYLQFAMKIADWTIKNMQSPKGNFYYQKWKFITNKVSYMRWNQGWMLLALTTLIMNLNETEYS